MRTAEEILTWLVQRAMGDNTGKPSTRVQITGSSAGSVLVCTVNTRPFYTELHDVGADVVAAFNGAIDNVEGFEKHLDSGVVMCRFTMDAEKCTRCEHKNRLCSQCGLCPVCDKAPDESACPAMV